MSRTRTHARVAALCGSLALLAVPVAIAIAEQADSVDLVRALVIAVPMAFVIGILGLVAGGRARYTLARSLTDDARRVARIGRWLAWAGIYISVTGALALGVYEILSHR